ncbi:MAG TPA: hypothetical protein DDX19_05130 [Rhodopirellula baltica]|nr:hypothetical protein [Rhodopirellula baltica]
MGFQPVFQILAAGRKPSGFEPPDGLRRSA